VKRFSSPELGFLLHAFVNQVAHPRGRATSFLARHKLSVEQAILLDHAARGGITPSIVAARFGMSMPSASQMVGRLARRGFVRRVTDARDRRRVMILVTAKAKKVLAGFATVRRSELRAAVAPFSPAARKSLRGALAAIAAELAGPARPARRR